MAVIKINGTTRNVDAEAEMPLLWVLRNELAMTGTKFGCGMGLCGACTVHIDGVATRSCLTPLAAVDRQAVTTIEGLRGKVSEAVRQAWIELDVAQCGYCQPGQIMAAVALLTFNTAPNDDEIDQAMSGNICRCGTYPRIRLAIRHAAQTLAAAK